MERDPHTFRKFAIALSRYRVDRMESLLEQLLEAQTSKKVPAQNKAKKTDAPNTTVTMPSSTVRRGLSFSIPEMGPQPVQLDLSGIANKEPPGLGNPLVIKKIVEHLQYEKSGQALILKKQAEIERLTLEVAQLKATFSQIEQLKEALKKAEAAKMKANNLFSKEGTD